jgi:hypothetical protein
MIFQEKYEAKRWFRKYTPYEGKVKDEIPDGIKFGDFVLFRHINGTDKLISRPILGVFVGFSVWDMSLVFQFVEKLRAWEYHHKVITNRELGISLHLASMDREVEYVPLWHDGIKVIQKWGNKPTISQLKQALYKQ